MFIEHFENMAIISKICFEEEKREIFKKGKGPFGFITVLCTDLNIRMSNIHLHHIFENHNHILD